MKSRHVPHTIILLLSLWLLPVQSNGASFRTICFFPVQNLEKISYLSKDQLIPVDLPSRSISKSYPYNPEKPIVFAEAGADAEKPVPLITVKPPTNLSKVLLVFLPASKESGKPCQVIVLNDSLTALKAGEMRFINLSSRTVLGFLGEQKLKIAPKKISIVKAPRKLAKDATYYVNIYTLQNKKPRPLCKTRWPHDADNRQLMFVFDDPVRKSIRMMGIDDMVKK